MKAVALITAVILAAFVLSLATRPTHYSVTASYKHPSWAGRVLPPGTLVTASTNVRRVRGWRWLRCNRRGLTCGPIPNASHRHYRVRLADWGHTLRAQALVPGRVQHFSPPTAPVGVLIPQVIARPYLMGAMLVGNTVTVNVGKWRYALRYSYTWQRCTDAHVCKTIPGEVGRTYTLQPSDKGLNIRVNVKAYGFGAQAVKPG